MTVCYDTAIWNSQTETDATRRTTMVTHQVLSGSTDEEFVERMATTYADRFGEPFWSLFTKEVAPALPVDFMAVDLGCGPGLFLHDLAARYPQATLYGYD